VTVGNAGQV